MRVVSQHEELAPRRGGARSRRPSLAQTRRSLAARLEARRAEIEAAALIRLRAISDPTDADPAYREGLRAATSIALDYALEAIERGEESASPPPTALLAQARLAARSGIGLDTVLRRYLAGHTLLADFLVEEAERERVGTEGLKRMLRSQAALLERLLAAVAEEHGRELATRTHGSERRRAERVERLLAGELIDTSSLSYDFEGWHLGILATGGSAVEAIRELAEALDRRLLLVRPDEIVVWAWLGGRKRLDSARALAHLLGRGAIETTVALGEPSGGLTGWRFTHRQAKAALPVALRGSESVVRYADAPLLASVLQDDLLCTSLRQLYLNPLERVGDRGAAMRETLRAYFAAKGNVSSAAARLGVSRQAVAKRLRTIEQLLAQPLDTSTATLELALRLQHLDEVAASEVQPEAALSRHIATPRLTEVRDAPK